MPNQQSRTNRCDICSMKDGWRNWALQQCSECGLQVHGSCYANALPASAEKDPDFLCKGCESIGAKVQGRHLGSGIIPGDLEVIKQLDRPAECVLCSVHSGNHAMHPLYDAPGRLGRQVILPPNEARQQPARLAWVHTLCAQVISSQSNTKGSVYACTKDGRYWSGEDVNDRDELSEEAIEPTHHFVLCGLDYVTGDDDEEWACQLRKCRRDLPKCTICGRGDSLKNALRVPIQCGAGSENEYREFKSCHEDLQVEECCYVAMHAGCAMWGKDGEAPPPNQRAFFYPGSKVLEPVATVYCALHAGHVAHERTRTGNKRCKKKPESTGLSTSDNNSSDEEYARAPKKAKCVDDTTPELVRDIFKHDASLKQTCCVPELEENKSTLAPPSQDLRNVASPRPPASARRKTLSEKSQAELLRQVELSALPSPPVTRRMKAPPKKYPVLGEVDTVAPYHPQETKQRPCTSFIRDTATSAGKASASTKRRPLISKKQGSFRLACGDKQSRSSSTLRKKLESSPRGRRPSVTKPIPPDDLLMPLGTEQRHSRILDTSNAAAVADKPAEKLSRSEDAIRQEIVADMVKLCTTIQGLSEVYRNEHMMKRKQHWKALSNLPKEDFKKIWELVTKELHRRILAPDNELPPFDSEDTVVVAGE